MLLRLKQLRSLALAVWSFIRWGDVALVEHSRRAAICQRCPFMVVSKTGRFCSQCDCPPSSLSDLRTKWRMLDIRCPIDKW